MWKSIDCKTLNLNCETNNTEHGTKKISKDQLIVRRGQRFTVKVELTQPFNPNLNPLTFTAVTGENPSEDLGTKSCFGMPDKIQRSPSAKAVWKVELEKGSNPPTGSLNLTITSPADTPIGKYNLTARHRDEETLLAELVVLFNPWCPGKLSFYLPTCFPGSPALFIFNVNASIIFDSISCSLPAQFEEDMMKICLKMLDVNPKHLANAANDVSARCNPIYISRVVSAMINNNDDCGVLEGRWSAPFWGGTIPSHWSGSYPILKRWYNIGCHPVKYGQCWVFAGVMCSVMRLLGIPCRVVTNYQSAHDSNKNLIIDVYHADYGNFVSCICFRNYHVWLECWMRRTDLGKDGKYDGWQVLDPTPQEKSDGTNSFSSTKRGAVFSMIAIFLISNFGFYRVSFFVSWQCKADGTMVNIFSDTKKIGQNISTKAVGSNTRLDITDSYKYKEDTMAHRLKTSRLRQRKRHCSLGKVGKLLRSFSQVFLFTCPGGDCNNYNCLSLPLSAPDLSIPILVPFLVYHKHMVGSDSMKISAVVTDKLEPRNVYLAVNDVILLNPPMSITVSKKLPSLCLINHYVDLFEVTVTLADCC
uniref:Protein-glutamine gamma-glutamyltransferase 2 n=1 Tax=Neolamprologus brichardi TaxID=32507 RepID=A0A3Q4MT79_NEOBR